LLFVDATYDIGKSGASRPRDLFLSRNETVGGTLNVTGAATLSSTVATGALTVTGAATVSTTLGVTGAATLSSTVATGALTVTGNETVSGTLGVTGATTLSSTLGVTGAATLSSTLGVTGVTTVAAGSAAAPAVVSVTGTSDTGVFFPAADTVAYSTAGSERLRIGSTGNVGIGTATMAGKLTVQGASTTNPDSLWSYGYIANGAVDTRCGTIRNSFDTNTSYSTFWTSFRGAAGSSYKSIFGITTGASDIDLITLDSSGKVGIGTTSPTYQTQVTGSGQTTAALTDAGAKGSLLYLQDNVGAAGSGGGVLLGTAATTPFAAIKGFLQNGSGQTSGDLCFSTRNAPADVALTERMRIGSTGNVGIGLTVPAYQLQVNTDSAGKPGVGGVWTVVSDERIKTDIVPADLDRCYEIVKSVPLKHFGFKPGVYTDEQIQDKHSLGWIAQDVQAVFEKAVSEKPFTIHTPQADGTVQDEVIDDCLDLNSGQMIAALYGCVQALMAKVEALEARG